MLKITKRFVFVCLLATLSTSVNAAEGDVKVLMQTNQGDITLLLNGTKAPKSVENFVAYAKSGYYDGTIFHRVISNFMIQGGGFDAQYQRKPTQDPINNEADNGLKNVRGSIAMARTGNVHSATSQFFINVKDNTFLNFKDKSTRGYGYTVFGQVVKGMDIVDKIRQVQTGPGGPFPKDAPREAIVITKVSIL